MFLKKIAFSGTLLLVLNSMAWGNDISDLSDIRLSATKTASESSMSVVTDDPHLYDELGPTLSLMKLFLREKFKPLPSGLRENVQEFFSSEEYNPHDCFEADKQRIEYDEELGDILCGLIRNEQKQIKKGNVTLYHGLSGDLFFTYRYLAEFFSALTGQDMGRFIFRGDHLYAKNPTNGEIFRNIYEIREFFEKGHSGEKQVALHVGDYGQGIDTMTLRCNIALSASPNTSKTSASSVGFMCQSFSVKEHKISDIVCSAFVLQGMPINDAQQKAAQVEDFYKQAFGAQDKKNGGILAVSLPKKTADDLALHVCMGGKQYDLSYAKLFIALKDFFGNEFLNYDEHIQYTLKSYFPDKPISEWANEIKNAFGEWNLQLEKEQEFERILQSFLDSRDLHGSSISYLLANLRETLSQSLSNDDLRTLTNEISLYLHPLVKMDVLGSFCHALEPSQQQKFDSDLRKLAASHAELILKGGTRPVDGVFLTPRRETFSENAPYQVEAIPLLLGCGKVEEAKTIALRNPKFHEDVAIRKMLIAKTLQGLNSGFGSILDCVEQICGKSFFSLLPPEHSDLLTMYALRDSEQPVLDHLFKFGMSETMLVNMLSSMSHAILVSHGKENYLNKMLEAKPLTQKTMEDIILHGDPNLLVSGSIMTFIKHGFSMNPNDEEGKKHLDTWLEICKKHQCLSSSIVNIIKHYKLTYENAKDLYAFLADERIHLYSADGCEVEYACCDDGCKVKIDELDEVIVPFGDLSKFHINRFTSWEEKDNLAKHLSQRFGRLYSHELIEAFVELQYCNISLNSPKNHKWLDELKKVQTLDEAKQLVYELDDLNILLSNLHLLDNLPDVQKQVESEFMTLSSAFREMAGAEYQKSTRENIVNGWFIKILEEYKAINEKNATVHDTFSSNDAKAKMFHDMIQQGLPLSVASAIVKQITFCPDLRDVLAVLSRVWKYNTASELGIFNRSIPQENKEFFSEFLDREIVSHPELMKDKDFVFGLFQSEMLPRSILSDKIKLKELFLTLETQDQLMGVSILSYSDNETLKSLAEEMLGKIFWPGTSLSIKEAKSVLADYGLE